MFRCYCTSISFTQVYEGNVL
uniref:Uncharacterized protein n=1 Tax=Anguilla anguilla TaxID=7936 RepID=A0A0E9W3C8_ANGAN